MRATPPHRCALHRRWRDSQLLQQLLRKAKDGEYAHRQQDVADHGHRFSVRDQPVGSIG
jgi:hypothetical protein